MAKTVDFYYGIGSRYSYLASSQIERLERDTGAIVRWRPLYSHLLMVRRGMDPFAGPPASGQYERAYRTSDVARWAAYYAIPFRDPDWDALDWQRYALAAVAADRLGAVAAFTHDLYGAVFGLGPPPTRDVDLVALAEKSGLDGAAFLRAIGEDETQRRHDQNIADALAAGVFGVPSFVVEGDLYWGNDRLVLLRDRLGAPA